MQKLYQLDKENIILTLSGEELDKENMVHKIRVVKLHKKRIGYFTRI